MDVCLWDGPSETQEMNCSRTAGVPEKLAAQFLTYETFIRDSCTIHPSISIIHPSISGAYLGGQRSLCEKEGTPWTSLYSISGGSSMHTLRPMGNVERAPHQSQQSSFGSAG
ncbi:hypothetical protein XENORESO_020705 [Xenotaenia resolanae]|uniref:Uncharacterized protein n=1 Tax=Xenotaenia resolanae TaxID=208358 RepID=A0ABV0VSA6_9TELE